MDRIGLVGQRAALAIEVAGVAARAGALVEPIEDASADRCDVVLVDVGAPEGSGPPPSQLLTLDGRAPTVAVCLDGEGGRGAASAARLGASHLVELPRGSDWLAARLGAARRRGPVLGVVGALGGVGTSTVGIAAAAAAARRGSSLLVDADPGSAGLDLALGIPDDAGVRWDGIPASGDPLLPESLVAALPTAAGVAVLTGRLMPDGRHGRVGSVLAVAGQAYDRTVVDLGRGDLLECAPVDHVALVAPATLAGAVAAERILSGPLSQRRVALVVRPSPWLASDELADGIGLPVACEIPRWRRVAELSDCGEILSGRSPARGLRRFGDRLWGALA